MNNKNIYTLEFNKIREMLAAHAATDGAKKMALELMPSDDIDEVRLRQARCADAKRLAGQKGNPSFGTVKDISDACERADKGATLTTRELLDCAAVMRCARSLLDYIKSDRKFSTCLDEIFERLIPEKPIEQRIYKSIISEDMIADDASPALADIRHRIRKTNAKVADLMQKYTQGGAFSKYLQENIVTTRGGRFVIPVKSEYRNEVQGLVHDTSSSGATLFIEPMSVVQANNELRELQAMEEYEIERILHELSGLVSSVSGVLLLDLSNITLLSFIFACSELAYQMDAVEPQVSENGAVRLEKCRHPLIGEKAVPVTVEVGGEWSMLVITGPNTGGKTVALKTIGLFSIMAQAGLQLPCESAAVRVFDEIYSDIGDEQSIEQSLSTFSSHMVGIVDVLKNMTSRSLVLFDELGSGTDPVEGAALAMSILEEVLERGALCAATTHYAELKAFAIERDGVCNASCEFDVDTLKPTYKLIIGTPGKSNAFAISERLGLPEKIVRRAGTYIDSGSRSFEAVIEKLEAERFKLESERAEAERLRREYEAFKKKSEDELKARLGGAEAEAEKAREKARQIVDSARATSDYIMKQLDEAKKAMDKSNFGDALQRSKKNIKGEVKSYLDKNRSEENTDDGYVLPRALKKGDDVEHRTLGTKGTLLEDPDKKGNVTVQMGILKTKFNVSQLKLLENVRIGEKNKLGSQKAYRSAVSKSFKPELDVRGMLGDDAVFTVDKYLDEALVARIYSVTVIHGKGTGALRSAIWSMLKKDRRVESYRAGQYGEGDYGVTVIELKQK